MKFIAIGLFVISVWFSARIIDLEEFRYSAKVGMCGELSFKDPVDRAKKLVCLDNYHPRTTALWNLYYGLF